MEFSFIKESFSCKPFALGIIFLWMVVIKCEGIQDFTCTSNPSRITDTSVTYLTAYLGSDTTRASVTFDLGAITGSGFQLPGTTLNPSNETASYIARHEIPVSADKARIGLFRCSLQSNGAESSLAVYVPLLSKEAVLKPSSQTITVSVGDSVDITIAADAEPLPKVEWRRKGTPDGSVTSNQLTYEITNATTDDAGVYECYVNKRRSEGEGAIVRLIVRGCRAGKWGSSCEHVCPICYNGGVCDDQSGNCVCAPGFSGGNCEDVHGANRFGQYGMLECSQDAGIHSNGCQGQLFCLPDPYGCSCAAGYYGLDCLEECPEGKFGASCRQTCHCATGGCLRDIGECRSGGCQDGWTGINCQVQDPCPDGYVGDLCQFICDCAGTQTCVAMEDSARCFSCSSEAVSPTNVIATQLSSTSYQFTWDPVQCSDTGVNLDLYEYSLIDQASQEVVIGETNSAEVEVTGLTPCTDLAFSVAAYTSVGKIYSDEVVISIEPTAPDALTEIEIFEIDDYTLQIVWGSPSDHPCASTYYFVEYNLINHDQCSTSPGESNNLTVNETSVTLHLLPYSTYEIILTGVNDAGLMSDILPIFYRTPDSVPVNPPVDVISSEVSSTSLRFEWGEVPCGSRTGMITGYRYKLTNVETGEEIVASTTIQHVRIADLTGCTAYNFSIAGRTNDGIGPFSEPLQAITAVDVPSQTGALHIPVITATSLQLSWDAPTSACKAAYYLLDYVLISEDQCAFPNTKSSLNITDTMVTLVDLKPNSVYEIILKGYNEAGPGELRQNVAPTGQSVPGIAPSNVRMTSLTTTTLSFAWDQIPCGSRNGYIYRYPWRLLNSADSQEVSSGESRSTSVTVKGLMSCMSYVFEVAAKTTMGTGPFSDRLVQSTGIGGASYPNVSFIFPMSLSPYNVSPTSVKYPVRTNYLRGCSPTLNINSHSPALVSSINHGCVNGLGPFTLGTYCPDSAPSAVSALSATELTNATLIVTWEPSSPCAATEYVIRYTLTSRDQCENLAESMEVVTEDTTITLNLSPYSNYTISVHGENSEGTGPVQTIDWQTAGYAPTEAIKNLTVNFLTPDQLELSWLPVASSPCTLTTYLIQYTVINQDQCAELNILRDYAEMDESMVVLSGVLVPYSTYDVSVRVINSAGLGPVAMVTVLTLEAAPSASPTNLQQTWSTVNSATISWNEIPCGNRGGVIQYKYFIMDPATSELIAQGMTSETEVMVDSLEACSSYTFSVSAVNSAGRSDSAEFRFQTQDAAPNVVENLTITPTSSGDGFELSWQPPSGRCQATRYKILHELNNLDQCQQSVGDIIVEETTDTSFTILNLEAYSSFTLALVASNDVGDSGEVRQTATTGEIVPSLAPPNINQVYATTTSIVIAWDEIPCESRGGAITQYRFQLTKNGNLVTHGMTPNRTVLLDQLEPCQTVIFSVGAVNGAGKGPDGMFRTMTESIAPSPVQNLTITPASSGDVLELSWQRPLGSCQPSNYDIQYQLVNLDQCKSESVDSLVAGTTSDTTFSIAKLVPYSTYLVFVTARNEAGSSQEMQVATTAESAPIAAPTELEKTDHSGDSISITWGEVPCVGRRGVITMYRYQLMQNNNLIQSGQTDERAVTLTMLEACSSYVFGVSAINSAGRGPSADFRVESGEVAPSPVENLIAIPSSSDGFLLSWQPPTSKCQPMTYRVEYEFLNRDQCQVEEGVRTMTYGVTVNTQYLMTGLEPYSTYSLIVIAVGQVDDSPIMMINATTGPDAPRSSPIDITINNTVGLQLAVTWQPPPCGNRNGLIVLYAYTLTRVDDKSTTTGNTSERGVVFTDLAAGEQYMFQVAAVTNGGVGPFSSPIINTVRDAYDASSVPPTEMPTTQVTDRTHPANDTTASTSSNIYTPTLPPHPDTTNITNMSTHSPDVSTPRAASPLATSAATSTAQSNVTTQGADMRTATITSSPEPKTMFTNAMTSAFNTSPGKTGTPDMVSASIEGLNVTVFDRRQNTVVLKWHPPAGVDVNDIQEYKVDYRASFKAYDTGYKPGDYRSHTRALPVASCTNCQTILYDLEPSTQYDIRITAVLNDMPDEVTNVYASTQLANDIDPPAEPNVDAARSTETVVVIDFEKPESKYVGGFRIAAIKKQNRNKRADTASPNDHVVGEIERTSTDFSIGDNKIYGGYRNPPLTEDAEYDVYLAYVSKTPDDEAVLWSEPLEVTAGNYGPFTGAQEDNELPLPITWIIVIAGIALILIVIIITCLVMVTLAQKKRKERGTFTFDNEIRRSLDAFPVDEADVASMFVPGDYHQVLSQFGTPVKDSKPVTSIISLKAINGDNHTNDITNGDAPAMTTFTTPPPESNGGHVNGGHVNGGHVNTAVLPGILNDELEASDTSVPLVELPKYVLEKKGNSGKGFQTEYKKLPDTKEGEWKEATAKENAKKNRYTNIVPYDNTRVKLQATEGVPHSDYINACYINDFKEEKRYIASQGPKVDTIADFWKMVWQHKATKIVMLTNCVEMGKNKCAMYWPDLSKGVTQNFDTLTVIPVSQEEYVDYTIRTFHMNKMGEDQVHTVKQFHFTAWPDMGVLDYPTPLLNFRKAVKEFDSDNNALTIVHCSAGVGRTGVYICVDTMLDRTKQVASVDVFRFVSDMRKQRCKMVQTPEQYQFIYESLLEATMSKGTCIPAASYKEVFKLIKNHPAKGTNVPSIDEQFELLERLTVIPSDNECRAASMKDNIAKNRFRDRLPRDNVRPILRSKSETSRTDYINAALIPGFRKKDMYIATQMPLPSTVSDLWRLVYDVNASAVVMLNVMNNNNETYGQYWTESGSNIINGNIVVDFESCINHTDSITMRTFSVHSMDEAEQSTPRTVQHFQFMDWFDDVPIDSHESLLALVTMVDEWQKKSGAGPVIVHCVDGVGCTGVFCALSTILHRLEESQVVDIFQAVKSLRMIRPNMVETKAQYRFLYEAVGHHISTAGPSAL